MNIDPFGSSTSRTYREVLQWASSFLEKSGRESSAAEWLLRERFDLNKTVLIKLYRQIMLEEEKQQFLEDVQAHATGIPVQHIVGHEWFYGRKFNVSPDVLIPRPETEELVELFLKEAPPSSLNVLDIGTGSGAIAVTVKKERPQDNVTATDISAEALTIAQKNAREVGAKIVFAQGDLAKPIKGQTFDVVMSNPPYIAKREVDVMDEVVLNHEPKLALFAEENGLAVYRKLANELPSVMKESGKIYLEIGYQQGEAVKKLFQESFPDATVAIIKDMAGRDRIVRIDLGRGEHLWKR